MARPTNGFDKRPQAINRKGRPKSFDALRAFILEVGNEVISSPDGSVQTTRIQAIIRDWLSSKDFRKQEAAIQYAYGKVPDKHEVTGADGGELIDTKATNRALSKLADAIGEIVSCEDGKRESSMDTPEHSAVEGSIIESR